MIPLRDENPTESIAYVTILLIIANVAIWTLVQGAGAPRTVAESAYIFGSIPCEVTGACAAQGLGYLSVLTSLFMHGGWEHLIGNMVFLWVFGNNVEDSMGHLRFVVFYLVCGVTAGAAHILLAPASQVPMVGASGAISGILGAYVLLYPRVRIHTWVPPFFILRIPAWFFLGYWFFLQLAMGMVTLGPGAADQGGIAVWAHVGGFVAGVVLIRLFAKKRLTDAKRRGIKLSRAEVAELEW